VIGAQLIALAVRRERLQTRADQQRARVADSLEALAAPLDVVDRAIGGVRWLRGHPLVWVVGVAVIAALRPRGMLGLAQTGLRFWTAWRALRAPQTRVAWALLPRALDLYQRWRLRRG